MKGLASYILILFISLIGVAKATGSPLTQPLSTATTQPLDRIKEIEQSPAQTIDKGPFSPNSSRSHR